jgi:hypothetical protein
MAKGRNSFSVNTNSGKVLMRFNSEKINEAYKINATILLDKSTPLVPVNSGATRASGRVSKSRKKGDEAYTTLWGGVSRLGKQVNYLTIPNLESPRYKLFNNGIPKTVKPGWNLLSRDKYFNNKTGTDMWADVTYKRYASSFSRRINQASKDALEKK